MRIIERWADLLGEGQVRMTKVWEELSYLTLINMSRLSLIQFQEQNTPRNFSHSHI